MLHFCPQCKQNYDCQPPLQKILASFHFPYGFRCGTPYEWRCPERARKMALLTGEKSPVSIPFAYKPQAAL